MLDYLAVLVVDCSFRRFHQVVIHHHSRFFLSVSQCLSGFEGIKKADNRGTVEKPPSPALELLMTYVKEIVSYIISIPKVPTLRSLQHPRPSHTLEQCR